MAASMAAGCGRVSQRSWHRGGAGVRIGGGGGLDLHRSARLMVAERQTAHLLRRH
jgi:hypothetical protein